MDKDPPFRAELAFVILRLTPPLWRVYHLATCAIMKEMLRGIASSLLSLVIGATFLWGGCVSCEQFFMFPGVHRPCCDETGKCQRPLKQSPQSPVQDCNIRPLALGCAHISVPALAVLPQALTPPVAIPEFRMQHWRVDEVAVDPSPPDLHSLYATFLI